MESNKQNFSSQLKPAWVCFTKIYQTLAIKLNRVEGKLVTPASKEGRRLFEIYIITKWSINYPKKLEELRFEHVQNSVTQNGKGNPLLVEQIFCLNLLGLQCGEFRIFNLVSALKHMSRVSMMTILIRIHKMQSVRIFTRLHERSNVRYSKLMIKLIHQ